MDENVPVVKTEVVPAKNNSLVYGLIVLLAVVLPVSLILWFGYMQRPASSIGDGSVTPTPTPQLASSRNFVNCADIRDTLVHGGLRYFACMGGIIGIDENGNVKDQYDMSVGMPSYTVTGLQIWKDKLIASTQNGIAIIDTQTKNIKKISVNEGLNEGSNAIVRIDGDTAWVGTFDGASRVDLISYEVTNYLAPQFGLGSKFNVGNIMVTPRAVYMINLASAYASGGVVRYLKADNQFQVFKTNDFGKQDRVDLFGIAMSGNNVVLSDMRDVFVFDDTKTDGPKKIDSTLFDKFAEPGQSRLIRIVGELDNSVILFVSGMTNRSYVKFDANSGLVTKFMDIDKGNFDLPFALRENVMWYRDVTGFVKNVDLKTGVTSKVPLRDRPVSFDNFGARINGLVYVFGSGYLWHYDPGQGLIRDAQVLDVPTSEMSDMSSFVFAPISGTDKIAMFRQTCGMGCDKPEIWIAQYPSFNTVKIDLPAGMKSTDTGTEGVFEYSAMKLGGVESGKIIIDFDNDKTKDSWYFDPVSSSWMSMKREIPSPTLLGAKCQEDFMFSDGKFVPISCDMIAASKYSMTAQGTSAILNFDNNGSKETFVLPPMWADYIPKSFSEFGWEVGTPIYFDKKVFIPTNRGVAVFDTVTKTIMAYGPEHGMLGNRSSSLLVDDNMIYSMANWGGLSVFSR